MVEKCTYCTNPQALPSLNLPGHDFRSLGYILTERLHYYLHPHRTYIKQWGQGRGDTFSLGLNPPPSSVNCKRLWALCSKTLRLRKEKLLYFTLSLLPLILACLASLSHAPTSSLTSTPVASPYVGPWQHCHGRH